jgi:hypothetical protein
MMFRWGPEAAWFGLAGILSACAAEHSNTDAAVDESATRSDAAAMNGDFRDADAGKPASDASASSCPPGPTAPLGLACQSNAGGTICRYGYDPPECGGRSVVCAAGTWQEESHSDPRPPCPTLPPSDQPCRWRDVPGQAKIVAIEAAVQDQNCKVEQKRVSFTFTPTDSAEPPSSHTLSIIGARNVPATCLAAEGLTLGAVLQGTRKTGVVGGCSSYVDFGRSFASCVDACGP